MDTFDSGPEIDIAAVQQEIRQMEAELAQTQKKMNLYMSIFFVYMSFNFKNALVIYWIISNLIQLAQQYFIVSRIKHKEEAKLAK